jgi:L-fuculose-phosphate aldolase
MATTLDTEPDAAVKDELFELARACRIFEIEGHGDRVFGHMALRAPDGAGFWMKRSGIGLGETHDWRDFVLLSFDGEKLAGAGRPHSEWPIHAEIMRRRDDVMASAHTHPFYASVFSASSETLRTVVARSASQPETPPRYDDTSELIRNADQGRGVAEALGDHAAVFLRNHGIVTCGRTIPQPVLVAIAFEKMCHEAVTIGASGLDWSWPDEAELAAKRGGIPVGNERVVWAYYRRKLARAEAIGDPLLSSEHIPIE